MDFYSNLYLSKLDVFLFALYYINMEVVLVTNDVVKIALAKSLLSSAGIQVHAFDENISSIEGAINVFPVRLMVFSSDADEAKQALAEYGFEIQ